MDIILEETLQIFTENELEIIRKALRINDTETLCKMGYYAPEPMKLSRFARMKQEWINSHLPSEQDRVKEILETAEVASTNGIPHFKAIVYSFEVNQFDIKTGTAKARMLKSWTKQPITHRDCLLLLEAAKKGVQQ